MKEKICCCHFSVSSKGSFICTSHIQDSTYHSLCYSICGALAGTRNSSMCPPSEIDPTNHCTRSRHTTSELHLTPVRESVVFFVLITPRLNAEFLFLLLLLASKIFTRQIPSFTRQIPSFTRQIPSFTSPVFRSPVNQTRPGYKGPVMFAGKLCC